MRRKLDYLPRGVRWAVRVLRWAGTLLTMAMLLFFPIALLYGIVMMLVSGSPWLFDLVAVAAAVPIAIGSAMRVTATCMELGHDPSAFDSDHEAEWKKLATACLHLLSLVISIGALLSVVRLLFVLYEKKPEIAQNITNFALHLVLAISLHRSAYYLERWFERRRNEASPH